MTYDDAVEFLDANKVEKGIQHDDHGTTTHDATRTLAGIPASCKNSWTHNSNFSFHDIGETNMADIQGYVNPRSLGNDEPNRALNMDLLFEQALWDKYIVSEDTRRRDLYTWDAMAPFYMQIMSGGIAARYRGREPVPGETVTSYQVKIGHHAPCHCRIYHHPHVMTLCIGLKEEVK